MKNGSAYYRTRHAKYFECEEEISDFIVLICQKKYFLTLESVKGLFPVFSFQVVCSYT